MNEKKAIDLKVGDKTPWYEVIEDAQEGTDDKGRCVVVKVRWEDGGEGFRAFDFDAMVAVSQ